MRKTPNALVLCLIGLLLAACSDDPVAPEPEPGIRLSLSSETLGPDETGSLSVAIKDVSGKVFALSLRIGYDPAVVEVEENDGYAPGGFLGSDALGIFQVDDGVIYLSLTDINDNGKALRSGSVGTITIRGLAPGVCHFMIDPENVRFIDATGTEVFVEGLELGEAMVTVE
ncbi:cohesin domain-containing protein [bacterium]|nr:cohesin domain-containing protein [bacterium]